jgi:hypothetical protein
MSGATASTDRAPDHRTLFPFPLSSDPALALNARARREGWSVHCDTQLVFDTKPLNEMVETWGRLCRPGRLPARADFTARLLKPCLRYATVLEIVNAGDRRRYRHRYVGSAVVERMGELTGVFLDEFLPSALYEKSSNYFDACVDHRCPIRVVTDFQLRTVDHTRAEGFVVPLADDGVTPNMILSIAYFSERPR